MPVSPLTPPAIKPIKDGSKSGDRQYWGNLYGAAPALAIVETAKQHQGLITVLATDNSSAQQLLDEIRFFLGGTQDGTDLPVMLFPDWETLPYDTFSPHQDIVSDRLRILALLPTLKRGILIIPVSTAMHRLPHRDFVLGNNFAFKRGDMLDVTELRQRLINSGYQNVNNVYEHGQFVVRGSLLDVFPMGADTPYRLDLLDNEIDSIREFDPETQRTTSTIDAINLLPGKEFPIHEQAISDFKRRWHEEFDIDHRQCTIYKDICEGNLSPGMEYYLPLFFNDSHTLFNYLAPTTAFFTTKTLEPAAERFWKETQNRYEERRHDTRRPILPPTKVFVAVDELFSQLKPYQRIQISQDAVDETAAGHLNFATEAPPDLTLQHQQSHPLAALKTFIETPNQRSLLCAESAGRRQILLDTLIRHGVNPHSVDSWDEFIRSDENFCITLGALDRGLIDNAKHINIISESQLFGRRVQQRRRDSTGSSQVHSSQNVIKDLTELREGAAVVHIEHGIGRYRGLQALSIDNQETEFLTLEYANNAKLYVPVANLHLISRYSGVDEDIAPLHKLGSDQWGKARRKAAEQIRDAAAELLDIYAKRAARPGHVCEFPEDAYEQFAAGFPFEETADQRSAIAAVIEDMKAPRAMDRLVCGDVGFGKTEVAMRAAFMAVHNNMQVAVLVPTTLLAQQHYESFVDRFANWPVKIEVLSRFKTAKEQDAVIKSLQEGKVDILIGTHRLLSASIKFSQLGLVIIDEEHRFGVRQKEQLKTLRAEVDILNLTATPIPRTLNMSMAGLRDLSIIATPPAKRLSIKTFVRDHDKALIKEAILRETLRGGQVYFLHNDVSTIERCKTELSELLPDVKFGIGHGQMRERDLEQVMGDFYHGRFQVLICSTIIETGIDVPNANTIIIERADKFGLAQLHQLRGRVGRSHHQAYAYLLIPNRKSITPDAEKRLDALCMAEDLGAGFTLATHDLEIRGAGELLGEEQSGQIQSIGFSLYMDMLNRAVNALQNGETLDLDTPINAGCEVDLHMPALIPSDYLPDVHSRLILYKRIANAESDADLRALQVEMIDRFGLLPEPTKNLFRVTSLKLLAQSLGIDKVEAGPTGGKLVFSSKTRIEPFTLVKLVQQQPQHYKLGDAQTLRFTHDMQTAESRILNIEKLLGTLTEAA
jgi:transcription-repair coupling factor (superfamily II helicase)